jgi:hypothetical protein
MSSTHTSELFAAAMRDSDTLGVDWLWLAPRLSSAAEQRYGYERALQINPESAEALAGLAATAAERTTPALIWGRLTAGVVMAR